MYEHVSDYEVKKWEIHQKKIDKMLVWGAKRGLVRTYDEELLNNLREYNYGGCPATILLLHRGLANGFCYDRGTLVALGFGEDDFNILYGDIDSIKLNPKYIEEYRSGKNSERYADHCVAERIDKDGNHWIYDTSLGLIYLKEFYWLLEHPKIRHVNDKENTLRFLYEDFVRDMDLDRDKYILTLTLPVLESQDDSATQPFYQDDLNNEIKMLKEKIDYDALVKDVHDDMKRLGML